MVLLGPTRPGSPTSYPKRALEPKALTKPRNPQTLKPLNPKSLNPLTPPYVPDLLRLAKLMDHSGASWVLGLKQLVDRMRDVLEVLLP